ncbi:MAG: hypothetical protein Q8S44_06145 [Flavobacteriaceae bacterium]|nr:hypothetical protein [Flavobacteriaceae bacterium]
MKKGIYFFMLAFYSFGTFCLPKGDFSVITDLPKMYQQCKTLEDKDLTPLDFITDHLLNIDGLFDKHCNGDEQKPHQPRLNYSNYQTTFYFFNHLTFSFIKFYPFIDKPTISLINFISSNYIAKIFRPPIAI